MYSYYANTSQKRPRASLRSNNSSGTKYFPRTLCHILVIHYRTSITVCRLQQTITVVVVCTAGVPVDVGIHVTRACVCGCVVVCVPVQRAAHVVVHVVHVVHGVHAPSVHATHGIVVSHWVGVPVGSSI